MVNVFAAYSERFSIRTRSLGACNAVFISITGTTSIIYSSLCILIYMDRKYYASVDVELNTVGVVAAAVSSGMGVEPRGIFLLGFFNSAMVTSFNFVIPTTGGSPFFTNSYMPNRLLSAFCGGTPRIRN